MTNPKSWRSPRRVGGVAATVVVALAMAWGLVSWLARDQPATNTVYATSSIDGRDPAELVGWADDVFLGRVIEKAGVGFVPDSKPGTGGDLPFTLYRVEVLESLKGSLAGVIEIRQDGGVADDGSTVLFQNDPLLLAGETCLFITKGDYDPEAVDDGVRPAPGRPRLVNVYGDVRVRDAAMQAKLLAKYRTAVEKQVAPEM